MSKKTELVQKLKDARGEALPAASEKPTTPTKFVLGRVVKSWLPNNDGLKLSHLALVAGGALALTLVLKPSKKKGKSGGCDCGQTQSKSSKGGLGEIIALLKFLAPAFAAVLKYFRPQLESFLKDFLAKQAMKKAQAAQAEQAMSSSDATAKEA